MVNAKVDIHDALVCGQQFQDSKNRIIEVAKTIGFALMCMVVATGPVYSDVGFTCVEDAGGL